MNIHEVAQRSSDIRQHYHQAELTHHGSHWSVEEDALAFLTDAGLVGRLIMAQQERWPTTSDTSLPYKIGECIWWLATLAERTGLDLEDCIATFLDDKEKHFGIT